MLKDVLMLNVLSEVQDPCGISQNAQEYKHEQGYNLGSAGWLVWHHRTLYDGEGRGVCLNLSLGLSHGCQHALI